ncbi:MAG: Protein of unknown function DUF16 [Rhodobacteraceae bacterium HLUCCA12]|nr:MAG: Protein of unknown function DUF16 [Rhodobacteraceae bacterium HLUCCA12]
MAESRIKREISAGSLINLGALAVAVAVAWGIMSERGDNTRDSMDSLSRNLASETANRRDQTAALDARIRSLESAQARADERFNSVLQVLGRIEARLERIEGRQ